jgi:hypothetical protein
MKNARTLVALFLISVFLAGLAHANTSSVNPNVPAQNSPLSSSVLRGNFGDAYNDENTIYGMLTLSSNQLLGTVNAGNAGPLNIPTCSTGALSWTPGTGLGCNSINGLTSPITQTLVFTGNESFNLNATSLPTKQVGTVMQLGNADTIPSRVENDAYAAAAYFTGVRSDGTNASPTTLQNLDEISGINAFGYNGSSVVGPRASVREFAAQNWTGSAQGTRIDISTTLNNTTSMSPVCGFENDGGVTCPPTVTGGSQGAGKINAAGLFVNGVAVSVGTNAFSSLTAATTTGSVENGAFAQTFNWDGLTTQNGLTLSTTTETTGQLFTSSVANAASTGYAGYFSNTGTAIAYGVYGVESGAANTGYAGYFSNTATATGYALYANGTAKVSGNLTVTGTCTGCGSGAPILQPDSTYLTDPGSGNIFPAVYTGGGSNVSVHESGIGLVASLAASPVLELRFQMPPIIPSTGTFKLVSHCLANATSGVMKYTPSDGFVAAGSSPSGVTLTGDTQVSQTWSSADVYVVNKTTLSETPLADGVSVVAVTFNASGWSLAAIPVCRWTEIWE